VTSDDLVAALSSRIPLPLAGEIVAQFFRLRQDCATATLGGSAPGKFVEVTVQILQFLESGKFGAKPDVDAYLRGLDSKPSTLDEGLRLCAARVARAMYTLRNKRNIAHLGPVDPNRCDLSYLVHSAQWVLTELLRGVGSIGMEEAGRLVEFVQMPVNQIVEDFGTHRLVLRDVGVSDEVLLLLKTEYPSSVPVTSILQSLRRRNSGSVKNTIRSLWKSKNIEGDAKRGYKLTQTGFAAATGIAARVA
jgi:hypothetical protein